MPYLKNYNFIYFSIAYTLFIIYGSLIPLDYQPIPFEQAWHSFGKIRYLRLGAASRADWIANIVLYIPLTFSLTAFFSNKVRSSLQLFTFALCILTFSLTLAVLIEFYQQFFPPRTVSINDLVAETIGSITGITLGFSYGKRFNILYRQIKSGGKQALFASATLYILCYFAISFFPYDFVASFKELQSKFTSENIGFFLSDNCNVTLRCTTSLASEVLTAIPLGAFFAAILKWHPQRLIAVMLIGFIFGVVIETVQLFLISGVAQGLSIFTRVVGMGLGEKLYRKLIQQPHTIPNINYRKYIIYLSIPYILFLARLNGWAFSQIEVPTNLDEKISNIHWLPFYYHYFTSEAVALHSLISVFMMYAPIGLGAWLWNLSRKERNSSQDILVAVVLTIVLSFTVETGKLFVHYKHPDPTNVLIAIFSSLFTYIIANFLYQTLYPTSVRDPSIPSPAEADTTYSVKQNRLEPVVSPSCEQENHNVSLFAKLVSLLLLTILAWKLYGYPSNRFLLSLSLLSYVFTITKYPNSWLILLPALLPVLDFAPWTGRFFFTEYDYLIILTVSVLLWKGRYKNPLPYYTISALLSLSLFSLFYLISFVKGLFPLPTLDNNAFTSYYSNYNSLRISNGFAWALLLTPFIAYSKFQTINIKKYFSYGFITALTLVSFYSIYERFLFSGLFNYTSDYRITAMFSSMHTGGGHIDIFLTMTMPFIAILFIEKENKFKNIVFGSIVFSASIYTLLVTFSRGPYIAFAIEFFTLSAFILYVTTAYKRTTFNSVLVIFLAILLAISIALPILQSSYIQSRFKKVNDDFEIRYHHWKDAIQMMDSGFSTFLFGMGLGTYPKTYFWHNSENTLPATYSLIDNKNHTYLRLGSGDSLYVEQIVNVNPEENYLLSLNVRSDSATAGITVPICEKALLYSFRCKWQTFKINSPGKWTHIEKLINMQSVGSNMGKIAGKLSRRPIKLSLYNGISSTLIDIKDVHLIDPNGNEVIKNGNFSNGLDHWFFSTDNHLPWHTKNIFVAVFFDQGILGLMAFIALLFNAFYNQFKLLAIRDNYSAILITSLIGFIIVGVVSSPFDAPNLTLLFFIILFLSLMKAKHDPHIGTST